MAQHGKPRSGCFAEQFCIVSSHAPCPLPSSSSSLLSPPLTVVRPVHGPWAELGHAIIVGIANLAETPQRPLSHAPYSLISSSLLPATNAAIALIDGLVSPALPFHRCCRTPPTLLLPLSTGSFLWLSHFVVAVARHQCCRRPHQRACPSGCPTVWYTLLASPR